MNKAEQQISETIEIFEQVAAGYDNPSLRFFPFCGDRIALHLQLKRGQKVLDIATGTGAALIAAAQMVGPQGRVQAIDLAKNMLDRAERTLRMNGLNNADFHLMDATKLDFKSAYFDAVICSFGLFFLPDMPAALKEWYRVLKPGGRLIFTSFSANAFQPQAKMFVEDIETAGGIMDDPGWQRLNNEDECRAILKQAGFGNIQLLQEQLGYHLNDEQGWRDIILNSGLRAIFNQLPVEKQDNFLRRHLEKIAALKRDKGLWLDVEVLFSSGQRPTDADK
ncbi:MAG TPA: methyltransferase domain-containing protein [Gammaproteobacteria bacterium]|nr:methyltransferase domain-containing protein [Gammaproteobacteria bacterium]